VIWRERYEPYGDRIDEPPAAQTNTRWHTGHVQDPDTGLVYAGARYYDPTLGRFLSIDPAGPNPNNLHSINRYAYGNNNPYRYVDPDGRCAMSATGSAEGAREALAACQAGGGEFGPDFLDYSLGGFDMAVPVGAGVKVTGRLLERAAREALTRVTDVLKPGGQLIGRAGRGSGVRELPGGLQEAQRVFERLRQGGRRIEDPRYKGAMYELPGGGRVGLRETSTSGPPTIDVNIPDIPIEKIKFL
jgi:RHS repeat-associated protein